MRSGAKPLASSSSFIKFVTTRWRSNCRFSVISSTFAKLLPQRNCGNPRDSVLAAPGRKNALEAGGAGADPSREDVVFIASQTVDVVTFCFTTLI